MATRSILIEFKTGPAKIKWWQPVYVFDPRQAEGYLCRVPMFLADWIIRGEPAFDWWPNVEGS